MGEHRIPVLEGIVQRVEDRVACGLWLVLEKG
jgi:hypothetical protein